TRALALGAKVISIKRLHEGVINKIDSGSSSFLQAKSSDKDEAGLGLMDRQRVKMWLRDAYREIDEVGI
ncbi:MAG: mobilization protein, partial [Caldimonas sp.]